MMNSGAVFSADRKYRYLLYRQWSSGPTITFVGLNPSTADETQDDPTIRRCIQYAKDWGFGSMDMLNIFAFRSTDPKALYKAENPVGLENDRWLTSYWLKHEPVVAAWGNHGRHKSRGDYVQWLWKQNSISGVKIFGLTAQGEPKHPLYLKRDAKTRIWTF